MDKFEQFFRENRLRLDTEDLDSDYIGIISGHFRIRRRNKFLRLVYAAASIAAITILSILLYRARTGGTDELRQPGIFNEIATDLITQESSYIQSIDVSLEEIKKQKVPAEYENMFAEFTKQLELIDSQYSIYRLQVEQHGFNDEIIQQIIYNYQLKLSVLQMLQSEINKINNLSKHEKHEYKTLRLNI